MFGWVRARPMIFGFGGGWGERRGGGGVGGANSTWKFSIRIFSGDSI